MADREERKTARETHVKTLLKLGKKDGTIARPHATAGRPRIQELLEAMRGSTVLTDAEKTEAEAAFALYQKAFATEPAEETTGDQAAG